MDEGDRAREGIRDGGLHGGRSYGRHLEIYTSVCCPFVGE